MISAELKPELSMGVSLRSYRSLVARVLASTTFAKSKRLSSLLAYLCELTFTGRSYELNEQRIGQDVFGRPRDYDSMIDGIVRTQASRLRQRLDQYFTEEGVDEPVRITIPRGSYVPLFTPRAETASVEESPRPLSIPVVEAEPQPVEALPQLAPSRLRTPILPWVIAIASFVALIAVLLTPALRASRRSILSSSIVVKHPIWSQIFPVRQTTLLVPGDSSLVIWQGLKNRNIDLDEYVSGAYRDANPNALLTPETVAINLASRRYTSLVDLEIAGALGRISHEQDSTLEVRYPRELRPNDLKQGNLILVGAAEADPWITLFERDMNFNFYDDRPRHIFSVVNRNPLNGEPKSWDVRTADRLHRVYAVVAWIPNLSGNGHVLLLEGTTVAGTECAWDFVSDDSRLLTFLQTIRRKDGSIPYFELLLGTNNISGSAVESTILAYRTH